MNADKIKANLTAEQWRYYENILGDYNCCDDDYKEFFKKTPLWHHKLTLEALAERNRLLDRALPFVQCVFREHGRDYLENSGDLQDAIAAALKGVGE